MLDSAALWEYICAVVLNWIAYMSAFPLVLDEIIKWCSPKGSNWIETHYPRARRRRFEIALMMVGFVIANFMAYKGERDAKMQALSDNAVLAKQLAEVTPSGQAEEIQNLKAELEALTPRKISDPQRESFIKSLKDSPKGPIAVIVLGSSAEATDFANHMRSLFDTAGYADPEKKTVVFSQATYNGGRSDSSFLATFPNDTIAWKGSVQTALTTMGIPESDTIDDKGGLELKPGEIAFVILGK